MFIFDLTRTQTICSVNSLVRFMGTRLTYFSFNLGVRLFDRLALTFIYEFDFQTVIYHGHICHHFTQLWNGSF